MVSPGTVKKQLKKLHFNPNGWGKSEAAELPHILVPDEEIHELANGIYEGGFALLVATNIRVILIDKKPLNYLTVEDLRFDMINEIDYSSRLFGSVITITTGNKTLRFTSYNQNRLRKLINHFQRRMAEVKMKESKHQEGQVSHLEKINEQLQEYLKAQQRYDEQLRQQLLQAGSGQANIKAPEPLRPSGELADYLYARGLVSQYEEQHGEIQPPPQPAPQRETYENPAPAELYNEGLQEIFHRKRSSAQGRHGDSTATVDNSKELNPLYIAYSKLPMALRNRRFGRPSFHSHSQAR